MCSTTLKQPQAFVLKQRGLLTWQEYLFETFHQVVSVSLSVLNLMDRNFFRSQITLPVPANTCTNILISRGLEGKSNGKFWSCILFVRQGDSVKWSYVIFLLSLRRNSLHNFLQNCSIKLIIRVKKLHLWLAKFNVTRKFSSVRDFLD